MNDWKESYHQLWVLTNALVNLPGNGYTVGLHSMYLFHPFSVQSWKSAFLLDVHRFFGAIEGWMRGGIAWAKFSPVAGNWSQAMGRTDNPIHSPNRLSWLALSLASGELWGAPPNLSDHAECYQAPRSQRHWPWLASIRSLKAMWHTANRLILYWMSLKVGCPSAKKPTHRFDG